MYGHEKSIPDELQVLVSSLTEEDLTALPNDLRVAVAMEDETMQRVFSRGEFPEVLSEKTGLGDNAVRKSLITLRDNEGADMRYVPEESRMVFGDQGRAWLLGAISVAIERS